MKDVKLSEIIYINLNIFTYLHLSSYNVNQLFILALCGYCEGVSAICSLISRKIQDFCIFILHNIILKAPHVNIVRYTRFSVLLALK